MTAWAIAGCGSAPCFPSGRPIRVMISYLPPELIVVSQSALRDQHRLRQVPWVNDDPLRSGGGRARATTMTIAAKARRTMTSSDRCTVPTAAAHVGGQFEVTGQVNLDAMALSDRDGRQPVQEPVHDLHRRLRVRVANTARHDHRPAARRPHPGRRCPRHWLRPANEADRGGGAERRQVVVVDAVTEARITDLVQSHELVEPIRPAVRHQQAVKRDGETRFARRHGPASFHPTRARPPGSARGVRCGNTAGS